LAAMELSTRCTRFNKRLRKNRPAKPQKYSSPVVARTSRNWVEFAGWGAFAGHNPGTCSFRECPWIPPLFAC
jgi:hypothetical protein